MAVASPAFSLSRMNPAFAAVQKKPLASDALDEISVEPSG